MIKISTEIDEILSDHHILRFIQNKFREKGDDEEYLNSALPDAFIPTFRHPTISVAWIEFFDCDRFNEMLLQAAEGICKTRPLTKFRPNSLFAFIKVGDLKNLCTQRGFEVKIYHTPEPDNPAHSSIGFPRIESQSIAEQEKLFRSIVECDELKYKLLEDIELKI